MILRPRKLHLSAAGRQNDAGRLRKLAFFFKADGKCAHAETIAAVRSRPNHYL